MTPERIHRLVCRFIKGGGIDTESLAQDIWLECFIKHIEPTYLMIRHRSYDVLRRKKLEQAYLESCQMPESRTHEYDCEYVHRLLESSNLTLEQKKLIWLVFWKGLELNEAAQELKMSPAQAGVLLAATKQQLFFEHLKRRDHDGTA